MVIFILLCGCTGSQQAAGTTPGPATTTLAGTASAATPAPGSSAGTVTNSSVIALPDPRYDGDTSVEEALKNRRSVRSFTGEALDISDVSQLLWAAQGITSESGQRTAPSAQRLYPLEVYVISLNVTGLADGTYRYVPQGHLLEIIHPGDVSPQVTTTAPAAFVIAIDLDKKPGARPAMNSTLPAGSAPSGTMSAPSIAPAPGGTGGSQEPAAETIHSWYYAETGHAAQNMYLQAESLDLGMVTQAGFDADNLKSLLKLQGNMTPYYFIPVGHTA